MTRTRKVLFTIKRKIFIKYMKILSDYHTNIHNKKIHKSNFRSIHCLSMFNIMKATVDNNKKQTYAIMYIANIIKKKKLIIQTESSSTPNLSLVIQFE